MYFPICFKYFFFLITRGNCLKTDEQGKQDCYGSGLEAKALSVSSLWGTKPLGLSAKQRFKFQESAPSEAGAGPKQRGILHVNVLQIFQEIK